ncbi:hypothetical protein CHELA1G11_11984 [Hyphomicrobiales bacterium]|nr:hypothetical protein CHELA1G11_11984 [Hyphomicrobiales bacterium]
MRNHLTIGCSRDLRHKSAARERYCPPQRLGLVGLVDDGHFVGEQGLVLGCTVEFFEVGSRDRLGADAVSVVAAGIGAGWLAQIGFALRARPILHEIRNTDLAEVSFNDGFAIAVVGALHLDVAAKAGERAIEQVGVDPGIEQRVFQAAVDQAAIDVAIALADVLVFGREIGGVLVLQGLNRTRVLIAQSLKRFVGLRAAFAGLQLRVFVEVEVFRENRKAFFKFGDLRLVLVSLGDVGPVGGDDAAHLRVIIDPVEIKDEHRLVAYLLLDILALQRLGSLAQGVQHRLQSHRLSFREVSRSRRDDAGLARYWDSQSRVAGPRSSCVHPPIERVFSAMWGRAVIQASLKISHSFQARGSKK